MQGFYAEQAMSDYSKLSAISDIVELCIDKITDWIYDNFEYDAGLPNIYDIEVEYKSYLISITESGVKVYGKYQDREYTFVESLLNDEIPTPQDVYNDFSDDDKTDEMRADDYLYYTTSYGDSIVDEYLLYND